jgi:hypothetical protein
MRLPRMTTRRWMIAAVLVGASIQAIRWHVTWYRACIWLAERRAARKSFRTIVIPGKGPVRINRNGELISPGRDRWYVSMSDKYYRAALFAWLPVERYPPEPE